MFIHVSSIFIHKDMLMKQPKETKNTLVGKIKEKSTGKKPCQVDDMSKISGHATEVSGIIMHEVKSTLAYSVEFLCVALN